MTPPSLPAAERRDGRRPRLVLIGGGARSGKSAFALRYARRLAEPGRRFFIATAQAFDDEMRVRIGKHRDDRGSDFETIEEPLDLAGALARVPGEAVALIDCLTLWLTNLLCGDIPEDQIRARIDAFADAAAARPGPTLVVTNEVGLGLVPETALGRAFRDLTGSAHQRLSGVADEVYAALLGMIVRLHPAPLVSFRPEEA